jgi:putative hemolysin
MMDGLERAGGALARRRGGADRAFVRDISYASTAQTRHGRAFIRMAENATGRLRLIRRAEGYQDEVATGRDFWEVMQDRYGLSLDVFSGSLANIPAEGPVVLIANHPFGILDGLMMGRILSAARPEFRILAHRVFRRAAELDRVILPISFDETREARALNVATRAEVLRFLGRGGAVGIFPGGTVSTAPRPFGRPMDPAWRTFTAKMIQRSDAQVVPIFFDGHNSRVFQIASHLHYTLRMAIMISEFRMRMGTAVRIAVGEPLPQAELRALRDPKALMAHLRQATYDLAPGPRQVGLGHEFEDRWRA